MTRRTRKTYPVQVAATKIVRSPGRCSSCSRPLTPGMQAQSTAGNTQFCPGKPGMQPHSA